MSRSVILNDGGFCGLDKRLKGVVVVIGSIPSVYCAQVISIRFIPIHDAELFVLWAQRFAADRTTPPEVPAALIS